MRLSRLNNRQLKRLIKTGRISFGGKIKPLDALQMDDIAMHYANKILQNIKKESLFSQNNAILRNYLKKFDHVAYWGPEFQKVYKKAQESVKDAIYWYDNLLEGFAKFKEWIEFNMNKDRDFKV